MASTNSIITRPVPSYLSVLSPEGLATQRDVDTKTGKNINWTCDPSVELPIKLDLDPTSMASRPPMTIMDQFQLTVNRFPQHPALRVKRNGSWQTYTWIEYQDAVHRFAKACISVGVGPHQNVNILGFNSPEWAIANMGAIYAGGISTGIYTTNNIDSTYYIAHHSEAVVAVTEDQSQSAKFLHSIDKLPHLKAIVQWSGPITPDAAAKGVISWNDFLSKSSTVDDSILYQRINAQRPGHCCTLIYTSGTTGAPKAVMLSHDNLTWTAYTALSEVSLSPDDRSVSYLPLSHIAAQILDLHIPMTTGASLSFAQPDALKGSLVATLQEIRPTWFFGVPRVWEKIEERMRQIGQESGYVKQTIGNWAKNIGIMAYNNTQNGQPLPWGWTMADTIVFKNVAKGLGLDQTRLRATAAAPIAPQTLEYFLSLNLPILEIYGMSESTGPHTINFPHRQKMFTLGTCFPGTITKLDNVDPQGNGEICMWGRHVFMGYLHNEEATQSTITSDGFLHSGDLGKMDTDGFLTITGRIKELLITAGGENVAPVPIEDTIKAELPLISNVIVIGDKRKYLTALITLKTEPTPDGEPSQILSDVTLSYINSFPTIEPKLQPGVTVPQIISDKNIHNIIQAGFDRANKKSVSNAQIVQKWALLKDDFSIQSELTPTLKLKRRVVLDKYKSIIEQFYQDVPAAL